MGLLKTVLKRIRVIQNVDGIDLTLTASWAGAVDLGDLKGKPFMTLTWDQTSVPTQRGSIPMGLDSKFETSTLEVANSSVLASLQAMRGKNVSLQCTPQGAVSATNPIVIIKNFQLLLSGALNIGDVSFIKLHGEKSANIESDIYEYDVSASAAPSGVIAYGAPANGSTIVLTGLPTDGTKTFTKVAADPGANEFSTIDQLVTLINNLTDLNAVKSVANIVLTVVTAGPEMNDAVITGTSAYAALHITFADGQ